MKIIADFHIHSKYSRATSKDMDLEALDRWAGIKGLSVMGTGDFTHPAWLGNIKDKLIPAEPGLYKLSPNFKTKDSKDEMRFILTSEISCIYSKNNKVRKIHVIIFAPSTEVVDKINEHLGRIGNLKSDGRPILGLDAKELAKIVLGVSPDCFIVPAHAWTPWFSIFGSKSGFNPIEECFEEYARYIYAIETGLSSDPAMNWRLSSLDKVSLISNSDAHSPQKIGREANVFDTTLSYQGIVGAIKNNDPREFLYTIEFFPEEGKYHYDGHRLCGISLSPEESRKYNNICPVCGRPLTIGVMNRVAELADRQATTSREGAVPFKRLIPLNEIIAESLGVTVASKRVGEEYNKLIQELGSEFNILLNVSRQDLAAVTLPEIAEGISRVREGKVSIEPGYDGVYGKIKIFAESEQRKRAKQKVLI